MMKKSIVYLIIIMTVSFLIASCDPGVKDGDDLVGKWMNSYNQYSEYMTFQEDNTGYYEFRGSLYKMKAKDFNWKVVPGQIIVFNFFSNISTIYVSYWHDLDGNAICTSGEGYRVSAPVAVVDGKTVDITVTFN